MSTPLSANDQAVKTLADKLWAEMLAASPIWGTFLGIEVNDGALDDNSDAARLRDRAMWERYGAAAAAIGDDGLDIEWKITRDLIKVGGEIAIEKDDHRMDLLSAVDHMDGVQTLLPVMLERGYHPRLAMGRMGVAAPVAGVIGAAVPVVLGVFVEGSRSERGEDVVLNELLCCVQHERFCFFKDGIPYIAPFGCAVRGHLHY